MTMVLPAFSNIKYDENNMYTSDI